MEKTTKSADIGRKDARKFIENERIEYKPFVALSDMHLVRKTIPLTYQSMQKTVAAHDEILWQEIDESASALFETHGADFNFDEYALGFTEGVAAVWEKIRDKVRP